jgi:hypothetical protein
MARQADVAAGMEANTGGGSFFSVAAGVLSFDGAPIPGNQMAVVILDHIHENVFYEGIYDAGNPRPPTCFAFARDGSELAPHETVVEAGQAQHETCKGCSQNEWGTAERGRGKACRNTRRLAMIPAGTIDVNSGRFTPFTDPDHFETATVGIMKIPVTSVNGFGTYVKQVSGAVRRPPHGVFTRVRVVPDPKTQVRVLFEPLDNAPAGIIPILMKRHAETRETIMFPYPLSYDEPEEKAPATRSRGGGGAPSAGRGAARNSKDGQRRVKY